VINIKFVPFVALGIVILGSSSFQASAAVSGVAIGNNTPRFTETSNNKGAVSPSTVMDVSIWLKPHNKADLDLAAKEMYDPTSSNYRKWLTKAEFMQRYGPTTAEAKTVEGFFTSHGMKVIKSDPDNFFVRAQGTAAQVSDAFHVTMNNYELKGKIVRANANDPMIEGEAAGLVASVAGLDTLGFTHPIDNQMTTRKPITSPGLPSPGTLPVGLPSASVPSGGAPSARPEAARALGAVGLPATNTVSNPTCFPGAEKETYTTDGTLPTATYSGNAYTKNVLGCGYTPKQIQTAYNLTPLYAKGFDGKGQTIVILDWCGSETITSDANKFSAKFGLPKLTASNFKIIYTPTPSYCEGPDAEINLDVEWAHAIAPGAAIDLVVPPSNSFQDIDEGLYYAIDYQLGNVISGSFGGEEYYNSAATLTQLDLLTETAAVLGISANFSTGDEGDFTYDDPADYPASVNAPADSPYATAIGGVSLALNSNNTIAWQTGWGTNQNTFAESGIVETTPSANGFFNFGSGGGPSGFFAKPSYQSKLPGKTRQLPDVSWLADPYTGVFIAVSYSGYEPETLYYVEGGTSLACPMFSALWAISNQIAGAPLGQAAPYLYKMPTSTITDILPYSSKTNVTAKVTTSTGTTSFSANSLAAPLEGTTTYFSTIWDIPLYEDFGVILTFGTDTSLKTAKGWDNVTGLGVPNGQAFAEYFAPKP